MSDAFESLEDHLEAAYDAGLDTAESSGMFALDNATKADWAIRKLAKARRKLAEAEEVADAEVECIHTWLADQRDRHTKDTEFLVTLLEAYHRRALEEDPKAKTLRLPAGELVARKTPDRLTADNVTFVAWAKTNGHAELVRVAEVADIPSAKKVLGMNAEDPDDEGRVRAVDPATGEVVPGAWFVPGQVGFTVRTDEDRLRLVDGES